jgi:hypothetical protein
MARKIGVIIILMLLIGGLIDTKNLVYSDSETSRAAQLSQAISQLIDQFSKMCKGGMPGIIDTSIRVLSSFKMMGWSNIGNWTKINYDNTTTTIFKKEEQQIFSILKFQNDNAKNEFCTRNFSDQKFKFLKADSVLGYLDRQGRLFDYIVDKFELYNWKSIDSYRSKYARIDNFKREILNKVKNNSSLIFYIPDPRAGNNPGRFKEKLFNTSIDLKMLLQPNRNARGLDKMWVNEIRKAIQNCLETEESYPIAKAIFYNANATITLSFMTNQDTGGQGNFWEMKMEFYSIGNQQKIQNLIENLDKVITNSRQVLNQKNNIKSWWENASPINLDYIDKLEKFKKDVLEPLNLNYTNTEAEARNYIQALICEKTPGGRDVNTVLDNLSEKASSTAQALEKTAEYISIQLKPATITVEAREVPIAVLPPKLFGGEHKGVESLAEITPERILNEIKDFLFKVAPTLFILLLVVGAIAYLITPVNLQYIQTGSEYIKWAIIGYFWLLVVTGIISAVRVIFGGP